MGTVILYASFSFDQEVMAKIMGIKSIAYVLIELVAFEEAYHWAWKSVDTVVIVMNFAIDDLTGDTRQQAIRLTRVINIPPGQSITFAVC